MAAKTENRGKKSQISHYKLGNPGGPGRPPIPYKEAWQKIKEIRAEGAGELNAAFQKVRHMTFEELTKFVGSKDSPPKSVNVLDLLAARTLMRALLTGKDVSVIIEAICGPEPKQLEITGKDGAPLNPYSNYTVAQLNGVFHALDKIVKENSCKQIQSSPSSLEQSGSSPQSSPTELDKELQTKS